jgi:16S rRNA C967 or C1407 C5-methylase (RsmB/RsmF family)
VPYPFSPDSPVGASSDTDRRRERVRETLAWFSRYDPLLDDRPAFLSALEEPPPVDLLVPPGRAEPQRVVALLERRGLVVHGFRWAPHHLRIEGAPGPGVLPEVVFGLAHPQGVVSGLAPRLLAPAGAERILDLCSAPGGKTLYLAALAGPAARLLANDVQRGRLGLVVQTLGRFGVASTVVVAHDGASFPRSGPFDRILVDAPCSGEGTFRIPSPRFEPTHANDLAGRTLLQRRLLARAVRLLAPEGRLVYATCSYAPEENEAVVHDVLARHDELDVEDLPAALPGLPAVERWNGERFDPRVTRCRRLLPHHTGSWGFFLAVLRRRDAGREAEGASGPLAVVDDVEEREALAAFLEARFAVPRAFLDRFHVTRRGRSLWILARAAGAGGDVGLERVRIEAPGLRAVRLTSRGPHASNGLIRLAGAAMTRHVVDLDWVEAVGLLQRGRGRAPEGIERGQVALRVDGTFVGAGFVEGRTLHLQIPKAWRPG